MHCVTKGLGLYNLSLFRVIKASESLILSTELE